MAGSTDPADAELQRLRIREQGRHGCNHYRRRCKLVAPCCNEVFWCRHCHNDVKSTNEPSPARRHELERSKVQEVVCALCELRQPVAEACSGCGVAFGAYYCQQCRFYDDDLSKGQFHCSACSICRVGGRENFFHCNTCGCCYSNSLQGNHTCVEDSMKQNCPVCFEFLFDSTLSTAVLPCGHTIHQKCLQEMEQNRQMACPMCMKSYANLTSVWRRIDQEIEATPMPADYAGWITEILCNDCNHPSSVPFHILGAKCVQCSSYNTRRIAVRRTQAMAVPPGAVGGPL